MLLARQNLHLNLAGSDQEETLDVNNNHNDNDPDPPATAHLGIAILSDAGTVASPTCLLGTLARSVLNTSSSSAA